MKWSKLLIFIFALNIFNPCFSQDYQNVVRTNVSQNINGKEFYLHKVQGGETLSAIARAYHVNIETILQNNYGLNDNIKPDDIIKIPVATSESKKDEEQSKNFRRVAKGETLFSLSQEYNVSVQEIKDANSGLPEGLKTGQFIVIPVKNRVSEQTTKPSTQKKPSKDYIEFQAREKTSIYPLALKYRISVDKIFELNPGTGDQLVAGEIIKIPLNTEPSEYIAHTVRKRQTMNKIAKKYDLNIEELKIQNPYLSRHLEVGQVLRIPLPELELDEILVDSLALERDRLLTEEVREISQKERCNDKYEMGEYDVALILPFYISIYDSVHNIRIQNPDEISEPEFVKPFLFIQFYEGFLMAVDSLKNCGLNIKLHVFNLEDDINQAKMLIKNPELKNMDLIVGPVYSSVFKIVADFAMAHQINIVNPLSTREEITWGNPMVFQAKPTLGNQNRKLVEYLNDQHDHSQIFIARHNQYRDETAFNDLKTTLDQDLETRKGPFSSLYHEIIYNQDSTYTFEHTASVDYQNVVIIYSESKVFILDIMRSLNELRDTFNIMVVGMPDWTKIEGLEAEHLNNLNTHVITSQYTNYDLEVVRSFVRKFRQRYATEPKDFAFSGYNTGIYFLSALMKFGPSFNACIPYFNMELLNMGYDFESTGTDGFQNKNWKILGMEDYKYEDVGRRLKTYDLSQPPQKLYKYMEQD